MKKIIFSAVLLMALPSCTFVCENACDGTDAIKGVVNDGLSFIPIVGPFSAQITDLGFDVLCGVACAPSTLGEEWVEETGISLDPTATVVETDATDPGS